MRVDSLILNCLTDPRSIAKKREIRTSHPLDMSFGSGASCGRPPAVVRDGGSTRLPMSDFRRSCHTTVMQRSRTPSSVVIAKEAKSHGSMKRPTVPVEIDAVVRNRRCGRSVAKYGAVTRKVGGEPSITRTEKVLGESLASL